MLNYQHLKFNSELSEKRMGTANKILGEKAVKRILAFALFLLGAHRRATAELLNMPQDTLKSFINRVLRVGITAFEDGRRKVSAFLTSWGSGSRKAFSFFAMRYGYCRLWHAGQDSDGSS